MSRKQTFLTRSFVVRWEVGAFAPMLSGTQVEL
jgi:hypothetical protein